MKTAAAFAFLAGLATAARIPVELPSSDVECKARPYNGPLVTNPDTASAFKAYERFSKIANLFAADQNTPETYATVPGFVNLNAAAQAPDYLFSIEPNSYDPEECAAHCNGEPGCTSFNIFYERVPLIVNTETHIPDPEVCPGKSTSPSATLIKCAFYSSALTADTATNYGQFQGHFEVVFAGSNAYFKWEAPTVSGFYGPLSLEDATIHAPTGYLGHETFPGSAFDPDLCADSCDENFVHDTATGTVTDQCISFNAFMLHKNGGEALFTCAYYSRVWGPLEATNRGQVDSVGNVYTIGRSYIYYLEEQYYLTGPNPGDEDVET
ncbi:hypothetical protein QBC34DRAFT_491321 [Podospora aff. communis PSN243]|uniref:Uncharacterized protein n=1 Tax=Podospora aff. communis PSN243 TaxID=3040156 RepID=A0AAV9GZL3_9PEZI|nr:hypothetical protein QBC34DRAFT_491321 [Podospora aff. communis PSN243]